MAVHVTFSSFVCVCARVSAKDLYAFVYDLAFGLVDSSVEVFRRMRFKLDDFKNILNNGERT